MKVVFDTNILVSALVFPGGRADIALRRIIETGFWNVPLPAAPK